jgi:LuxR family quorum sensing-dependent transcriptional regulator
MSRADFAFECIEAMERVRSPNALLEELAKAGRACGFTSGGIATIPNVDRDFKQYAYIYRWPFGWFERYSERNYLADDPVIRRLRSSVRPFAWHEATYDREREPAAGLIMNEATEYGLNFGFTVPVYTLTGDLVSVTFGGDRFDMSPEDRRTLHLIAIYAHAKIMDLIGPRPVVDELPKLSPRELEVLKWSAAGKTSRDIADILNIAANTVETYMANACLKLDAVTRTQAVAQAIRARLIK